MTTLNIDRLISEVRDHANLTHAENARREELEADLSPDWEWIGTDGRWMAGIPFVRAMSLAKLRGGKVSRMPEMEPIGTVAKLVYLPAAEGVEDGAEVSYGAGRWNGD